MYQLKTHFTLAVLVLTAFFGGLKRDEISVKVEALRSGKIHWFGGAKSKVDGAPSTAPEVSDGAEVEVPQAANPLMMLKSNASGGVAVPPNPALPPVQMGEVAPPHVDTKKDLGAALDAFRPGDQSGSQEERRNLYLDKLNAQMGGMPPVQAAPPIQGLPATLPVPSEVAPSLGTTPLSSDPSLGRNRPGQEYEAEPEVVEDIEDDGDVVDEADTEGDEDLDAADDETADDEAPDLSLDEDG